MKHVLFYLAFVLSFLPATGFGESLDFELQVSPYGGTYVIPMHNGSQYISHSEIYGQVASIIFTSSIEHNLAWCAKITFKGNTTGTNLTGGLIIKYKNPTNNQQSEIRGRYNQNRQSVNPGGISPMGNPNINAGQAPPNLYNAMSPIYAQGLTAVFIWQMAPINNNQWQDIPGANQASYQPPVLYNSTRYRRGVKVSAYPDIAYSNEIQCLVSTVLSSGIIAKDQTIDFGKSCSIESYEAAQGLDFAYQWQCDYGEGWQPVPGETKETLEIPILEQDTKFRRLAVSESFTAYSNIIQVSVGLFGGQIEGIKWSRDTDIIIGANAPCKGGNLDFTYQWQSYDGSEWQNIPGQTRETYICRPLTVKKIIRRMVMCGEKKAYSTECTIMPFSEFRGNFVITQTAIAPAATEADYISDISYFDGLGRHEMLVSKGASSNGRDLIKPTYYDHAGRDNAREYLPFVGNDSEGDYLPDVFEHQRAYFAKMYPGDQSYAFQETIFEPSVLDRPLATYNAGSIFRSKDKKTRFDYDTNSASDSVFHLKFNVDGSFNVLGFIPENTLYRNTVENEDDAITISFTDQLGRKILERTIDRYSGSSSISMDTYYVFDDRDRLCVVVSPQGSTALRSGQRYSLEEELVDKYCYYYLHDDAGRVVERKLPGKDIEYLIYDKGDRLVLSQDGTQRERREWTYNVYDNFNRLVSSSLVKQQVTLSRQDIQNRYNGVEFDNSYPTLGGSLNKYKPFADNAFTLLAILSESRYGNSDSSFTIPDYLGPKSIAGIMSIGAIDNRTTGLKSYDKIAITDTSGYKDINYIERAYYYDYKGRVIQTVEKNHLDGISRYSTKYDFTGNVLASHETHLDVDQNRADTKRTEFTYDNRGRLRTESTRLNDSQSAIIKYGYDELGKLDSKDYYVQDAATEDPVSPEVPGVEQVELETVYFYLHKEKAAQESDMLNDLIARVDPNGEFMVNAEHAKPEYFLGEDETYRYYYIPKHFFHADGALSLSTPDIYLFTSNFPHAVVPAAYVYLANETGPEKVRLTTNAYFYIHKERAANSSDMLEAEIARRDSDKVFMINAEHARPEYFICEDDTYRYYYIPNNYLPSVITSLLYCPGSVYLPSGTFPFSDNPPVSKYIYSEHKPLIVLNGPGEVNGTEPLLTETFDYNIQGWLTNRSSGYFDMKFRYYDPLKDTSPSYTGNISEWTWQHGADGDTTTYAFVYDALSRLKDTKQYINSTVSDLFTERGLSYDKNGNIQTLLRTEAGVLHHNFTYGYTGNRLTALADNVAGSTYSYSYDSNGNMTYDGANNLNISYNQLNLTEKVERSGDILAKYSYLSDGTKLSATDADGNGLYYLGSLVYCKQDTLFSLESAAFSGGRFVATASGIETRYHLTDHLGSVRTIVNGDGETIERNDFYPFGMRWNDPTSQFSDNRYRYNGKEDQSFLEVPYIDYGARMYDSKYRLSWGGVDPLAEKSQEVGPYVFCLGNPVKNMDPDGRIPVETIWDVVNIADGARSLINNISAGNVGGAIVDGLGLIADVAAAAVPYVPGGAHTAIKGARAAAKAADKVGDAAKAIDKGADAAKAVDKGADAVSATKRGVESEAKVLKDMGLEKNTKAMSLDGMGGKKTIPDAVDSKTIYEVKDTKKVSNTQQIRQQRAIAKRDGKDYKIITGNKTHVTRNINPEEVIRRQDLGPQ